MKSFQVFKHSDRSCFSALVAFLACYSAVPNVVTVNLYSSPLLVTCLTTIIITFHVWFAVVGPAKSLIIFKHLIIWSGCVPLNWFSCFLDIHQHHLLSLLLLYSSSLCVIFPTCYSCLCHIQFLFIKADLLSHTYPFTSKLDDKRPVYYIFKW